MAESGRAQLAESQLEQSINAVKTALDELVGTVDATTAIDTFNEIETFLAGVTNEKTLTGMLAVTDGKAVTAQTTADAAKSTAQSALSKATANETKLNTIPEMPANDGKIYGFCNGAWVVIAEVGKMYIQIDYEVEDRYRSNLGVTPCGNLFDVPVVAGGENGKCPTFR